MIGYRYLSRAQNMEQATTRLKNMATISMALFLFKLSQLTDANFVTELREQKAVAVYTSSGNFSFPFQESK